MVNVNFPCPADPVMTNDHTDGQSLMTSYLCLCVNLSSTHHAVGNVCLYDPWYNKLKLNHGLTNLLRNGRIRDIDKPSVYLITFILRQRIAEVRAGLTDSSTSVCLLYHFRATLSRTYVETRFGQRRLPIPCRPSDDKWPNRWSIATEILPIPSCPPFNHSVYKRYLKTYVRLRFVLLVLVLTYMDL